MGAVRACSTVSCIRTSLQVSLTLTSRAYRTFVQKFSNYLKDDEVRFIHRKVLWLTPSHFRVRAVFFKRVTQ